MTLDQVILRWNLKKFKKVNRFVKRAAHFADSFNQQWTSFHVTSVCMLRLVSNFTISRESLGATVFSSTFIKMFYSQCSNTVVPQPATLLHALPVILKLAVISSRFHLQIQKEREKKARRARSNVKWSAQLLQTKRYCLFELASRRRTRAVWF